MKVPAFRLLALAVLATPLAAQTVHVVDQGDGPGADFTTITEAVEAAGESDVILIRSGDYPESIVIDAKSLTLLEARGADVTVDQLTVQNLVETQNVSIRGLTLNPPAGADVALEALTNEGVVWIEDVVAQRSVILRQCESVVLTRCTVPPVSTTAVAMLESDRSRTYLYGVTISAPERGIDGITGILMTNGFLYVEDTTIQAGDGGGSCPNPGRGGHAIVQAGGGLHRITTVDAIVLPGDGGNPAGCASGPQGEPYTSTGGGLSLQTHLGRRARRLSTVSPANDYQVKSVVYEGLIDDVVQLLYSGLPTSGYGLVPHTFAHVMEPGYSVYMGTAPASGVLVRDFAPFDISLESLTFYGQALFVNFMEVGVSNPIQIVILNGEPKLPRQSGPPVGTATRTIR